MVKSMSYDRPTTNVKKKIDDISSNAMYSVVISYETKDEIHYIALDTVEACVVNTSSNITQHPAMDGFIIGDHMYRNPVTMSVSGIIGLNGSNSINVTSNGSKLAAIQKVFEDIKNNGTLCVITKIHSVTKNTSFIQRSNMALTSIQWTENINTLQYSFTFTEVMTASYNVQQIVDTEDPYLPDITQLQTSNFVGTSLDWGTLDTALINALSQNGLIEDKFLDSVRGYAGSVLSNGYEASTAVADVLGGIAGGSAAVAATAGAVFGTIAATNLATGAIASTVASTAAAALGKTAAVAAVTPIPGARIVAGVALAAAGIAAVTAIGFAVARCNQYKVKKFKYYSNEKKRQKEIDRFVAFVTDTHASFSKLNDYLSIASISEDKAQECLLTVDSEMCVFSFNKDNTANRKEYLLGITVNGTTQGEGIRPVSAIAVEDFLNCTSDKALFRASQGSRAYLVHPSQAQMPDLSGALTEYQLIIARNDFDVSKLFDTIQTKITEALSA